MVTLIDKYTNKSNLVLGASNLVLIAGNSNLGAASFFLWYNHVSQYISTLYIARLHNGHIY